MNYIKVLISTILTLWSASSLAASQGGGLPQMDIGSYPSQILWLIITFGALYVFMWKIAIPQLRTTVEERKDKVSMDLNDAEQLKTEAKSILEEYEAKITNSNLEAASIYTDSKTDIDKKIELSKKKRFYFGIRDSICIGKESLCLQTLSTFSFLDKHYFWQLSFNQKCVINSLKKN